MAAKLFLFDIDGTLVDLMRFHIASFQRAYKQVLDWDVSADELAVWFGLPDVDIHKNLIKKRGVRVDGLESRIQEIILLHKNDFLGSIGNDLSAYVLPGVVDFLEYLKSHKIPAGIVTGNTEEKADLLLARAGLSGYFTAGGYGDGAHSRKDIVLSAMAAFRQEGYDFVRAGVYVIGDSVHDIKAANDAGVVSVGVATGFYDEKTLKEAGAKLVLRSLAGYRTLL